MEILIDCHGKTLTSKFDEPEYNEILDFVSGESGINEEDYFLIYNGRVFSQSIFNGLASLNSTNINLSIQIKGYGGKGGFGSLLRGQAVTKKKFDNRDASRDLQGRRLRNSLNEQRLKEFVKKKVEEDIEVKEEMKKFNQMQKIIRENQKSVFITNAHIQKVEGWKSKIHDSIASGLLKRKVNDDIIEDEIQKKVKTNDHEYLNQYFSSLIKDTDKKGKSIRKPIIEGSDKPEEILKKSKESKDLFDFSHSQNIPLDLGKYKTAQDLESIGAESLKKELNRLGLKCGGTISQRADRLWNVLQDPLLLYSAEFKSKLK